MCGYGPQSLHVLGRGLLLQELTQRNQNNGAGTGEQYHYHCLSKHKLRQQTAIDKVQYQDVLQILRSSSIVLNTNIKLTFYQIRGSLTEPPQNPQYIQLTVQCMSWLFHPVQWLFELGRHDDGTQEHLSLYSKHEAPDAPLHHHAVHQDFNRRQESQELKSP